ncbi:DUF2914 domain-containing protein [Candidatus Parcubacteria bacterium]|uniref:DUF2914 domain-containing protein n=1 Tax=Candidatus Kaiserbacteria bacterium CG10_big_fil_rev_8_21_14_0_10_47_16 TaxID=1974608 RepID=A0A2H0UER7_9BACT|nr:DUF2914 domain-containing protein [Candidatus Parcubacteria bacterium]PIR84850.1 MAG: hypothetical protein COU16_00480 [Candidatus Kaiserbacteria bacterium CG10_big_fil_rev_8_21_14_0_10_47_16]
MAIIQSVKKTFEKHREHWLTVAFFFGFLLDNLTLNRVDQIFDISILAFYVVLAMGSMLLLYAATADRLSEGFSRWAKKYTPLFAQYAFGGLFSGMLIFYGRSGSWYESWPYLLIILGVIFGNETIKDRTGRLIFTLAMLFVGLFSYVVLIVPVFIGKMGAMVFVGSGILALVIMLIFMRILRMIIPNFFSLHQRAIIFTIGIIFALFNFLYFTNIIPPIPLSLKDVGIYHSVIRFGDGTYQLTYEDTKWWEFFRNSDTTFHYTPGSNVYCFASVFAPTRLSTDIYHSWDKYNDATGEWVEYSRLSYPISGGRGAGFRGYTFIKNSQPGTWRCQVETARGQVLGAEKFVIEPGVPGELVTRTE